MNKSVVVSLLTLIAVGICVSRLKYEVVFLRNRLKEINQSIEKYSDDIKIYTAEWACLNDPKRLKMLAEKHLKGMRPMEQRQRISYKKLIESDFEKSFKEAFKSFIDSTLDKDELEPGR
ncbi:MAG: hypothetical protein LBT03_00695 [Holosporales bacterium]|jgi:hypothetical protein|nr:hypothetical protein [Holosporales bacterium]